MKFTKYILIFLLLSMSLNAKKITINFQNTPIMDVVKLVAKKHKKNILINQNINGNINFISHTQIDEKELLPLLEHILRVKGFAISKTTEDYYEIVKATDASKEIIIDKKHDVGMQMEIFRPKFIKPTVVSAKIKHLASPYALITTDDTMNMLLITDYPKNLTNVKKLLSLFDTHLKREFKMVTLKHYHVNIALKKLQDIFKLTADQYKGDITLLGAEYQNAVWVSANSEDMPKVVEAIKFFDNQAKDNVKTTTKIIFLKNANAEDIIKTIQTIATSLDKNNPIKTVVTSNKELNSVIISSSSSQIKELVDIINQIDIERRQVFVKVQLYEVSKNKSDKIGIKWGITGGYAGDKSIATSTVNMGGSYFALDSSLSDKLDINIVNKGVAVAAMIDFMKEKGAVNTLSEPTLLCLNNVKSSIYVGKTQSILTSSATGDNSGDITRNNYTREDIGLKLEVTPQIADKDKVILKVKSKIEGVDQSNANTDRPTTTKRELESTTIVQNGESIIIGGMLRDDNSISKLKVPLLGDIPFLGGLFRHSSNVNDKVSLVVIMTPFIVNSSLELQKVQTKLEKLNAQKVQLTNKLIQSYDGIKSGKRTLNTKDSKSPSRKENMELHEKRMKMLMGDNY